MCVVFQMLFYIYLLDQGNGEQDKTKDRSVCTTTLVDRAIQPNWCKSNNKFVGVIIIRQLLCVKTLLDGMFIIYFFFIGNMLLNSRNH